MNTFYSIVSATINPLTNEKISLGLVLSDNSRNFFTYSTNKLSLVKNIVSKEQHLFIRDYLRSFDRIIEKIDKNPNSQTSMEVIEDRLIINEPYFEYMSTYGHNIITVSKPIRIDIIADEDNFNELFSKFIYSEEEPKQKDKKNILQVKDNFSKQVDNYFSIEKELNPSLYPKSELPVTVDLFGKNEIIVIGQFIDFERIFYYIKPDYFDLKQIGEGIEDKTIFLISREPDKSKFPQQHELWKTIRKKKQYRYTDISEVEVIQKYAKEEGVKPY